MTLQALINQDLKTAMKEKDELRLSTLRLLKSEIQYELTKTGATELSDEQVIQLLKQGISRRKDTAQEYHKAGRSDLAEKEEKEHSVLLAYLPPELPDSEIIKAIQEAYSALQPKTQKDAGKMMGKVMQSLKGKNANGTRVSELVKDALKDLP